MNIGDVTFWGALALVGSANVMVSVGDTLPRNEPATSDYFEVHSLEAVRVGDTAAIFMDRTIHAPVTMSFSVRVMGHGPDGWVQFCQMEAEPFEYRPAAALFDANSPVDGAVGLSWWTYGKCPVLPDGAAQIWTTWSPKAAGLFPVSTVVEVMP